MKAPGIRSRHGLNSLKARVAVRGLQAIDRRTLAARGLLAWKADLTAALGADLSPQQQALVEAVTRARLYLEHVDSYLLSQASLVNRRRQALLPIVRERIQLQDSLLRILQALGLERKARDLTPSLEVIRQQFAKVSNGDGQDNGR